MKKDEYRGDPNNFKLDEVQGLTKAPDGLYYANLSGFRQVRVSVRDFLEIEAIRKFGPQEVTSE